MARGRNATDPREIPAPGWKDIALRVKDQINEDSIGLVAAGVAFYGLLALFPAITALLALGGLAVEPSMIVDQIDKLKGLVPQEVIDIVVSQATEVAGSREGGLGLAALVGLGVAIYSASKGVASLMQGMNVAYDETESRGFFWRTMLTLSLTIGLIFGVLFAFAVAVGVPAVLAFLPLGPLAEILTVVVVAVVMIGLIIVGLSVLYHFGPSRDNPEWAWVTPGAVIACLVWIVASAGFAFYVANFGSYNESFGTLAGVIVLLMWFWISAWVVLAGAELNSEMEAQTKHDTTVGPDAPMGARDAVKADKLGEPAAET